MMMVVQKRDKFPNSKNFGFDTEADFIPFEFSDDDNVNNSRQESRMSMETADSMPPRPLDSTRITNGDGLKRKRRDIESSSERGPPSQRQKLEGVNVNPWQTDLTVYASINETAKMYLIDRFEADY
jgi:hypothetical protein